MVSKAFDKAKLLFVQLFSGGLRSMIPFAAIDVLSLSSFFFLLQNFSFFGLWFVNELLPMRHFPALSTWKKRRNDPSIGLLIVSMPVLSNWEDSLYYAVVSCFAPAFQV